MKPAWIKSEIDFSTFALSCTLLHYFAKKMPTKYENRFV